MSTELTEEVLDTIREQMLDLYAEWQQMWAVANNDDTTKESWLKDLKKYSDLLVRVMDDSSPSMVELTVSVGDEAGSWELYAFIDKYSGYGSMGTTTEWQERMANESIMILSMWQVFDTMPNFICETRDVWHEVLGGRTSPERVWYNTPEEKK